MLEPDGRVVLLDQLRPPPGYRLHSAVATTFTLSLTAAVVPPLAFASFEMRGTPDPIAALEAVRSCTDRVDIFCQAGQIVVPRPPSALMAYLEPMVHAVKRPNRGFLFHPKMWFLRYEAEDDVDRFRLLCTSRNLVESQAWDAVVILDGIAGTRRHERNRPLAALIRDLPRRVAGGLDDTRAARVRDLATAAQRVEWTLPPDVDELNFHTLGVPNVPDTADFSSTKHLVISPYCDVAGVARMTDGSRKSVTVISRQEELDKLPEPRPNWNTFVLDPLAVLNPNAAEAEDAQEVGLDTLSGLHAKIVVAQYHHRARMFIGSANATGAAFSGNVEFMVELGGRAALLGIDGYLSDASPFRGMLLQYQPGEPLVDPTDELIKALRNHLRRLAEIPLVLTAAAEEGRTHSLELTSQDPLRPRVGQRVTVELLTVPGKSVELSRTDHSPVTFTGLALTDITPFVIITLTDVTNSSPSEPVEVSTVVQARLINDPPDRLDAVLASQIDSPEKFLRFLQLLLGLTDGGALLNRLGGTGSFGSWAGAASSGVFETLVTALATNPAGLRDLGRLVARLRATDAGRAVMPEGFDRLWQSVEQALAQLEVPR